MKKLRKWLQNQWRTLALWSAGILSSAYLLLTHLGSLTHGISHREVLLNQFSSSLQQIAHYPVGLPLHLVQWLFGTLPFHTALWLRVPAILFALSTLLCVTYIMRRWYGPRTALFGFLLFASSAWFLHVGRLATDDILLLWAVPVLLVSHLVLHDYTDKKLAIFFWVAASLTLLYIPGMIWFVLANIILQWTDIREALAHHKTWLMRLSLFLTGLVLISPLAYGLAAGPTKDIGLKLLGAPTTMPQLQTIAENMRDASMHEHRREEIEIHRKRRRKMLDLAGVSE